MKEEKYEAKRSKKQIGNNLAKKVIWYRY